MSNLLTMILVLGGTFVAGAALLYLSLISDAPRRPAGKRDAAAKTTAAMAAAQDAEAGSSRRAEH